MSADLITRLESADGPDRELDCRIWCAMRGADFDLYSQVVPNFNEWQAPRYTASIDAALTLVPEGWKWAVTSKNSACCHEQHIAPLNWFYASTPALALAAAALKARGV